MNLNTFRVIFAAEHLRRKDKAIKQALTEKQALVADILNLSREDFEHVADIAAEPSELEKEPAELILAAINQGVFIKQNLILLQFIYFYFKNENLVLN